MKAREILLWGDLAFYFAVLCVAALFAPHTAVFWTAVTVAAVRFPLWGLARLQLGSAFSFRAKAHHLVTSGLYSKLRHPVYVFGSVASLSTLVALQIWPIVALGVALIPITLMRARREEHALAAKFGRQYHEYRRRTWF